MKTEYCVFHRVPAPPQRGWEINLRGHHTRNWIVKQQKKNTNLLLLIFFSFSLNMFIDLKKKKELISKTKRKRNAHKHKRGEKRKKVLFSCEILDLYFFRLLQSLRRKTAWFEVWFEFRVKGQKDCEAVFVNSSTVCGFYSWYTWNLNASANLK